MSQRPIHEMEAKWQADWLKRKTYAASNDPKLPTFYGLIEFPFPSGEGLHVGHPRSYTAIDAMTRKQRMEGKNVLFPIGWDAFGLPTENYAIKNKVRPQDASKKNIGNFRRQLQSLGFGFDWDREVDTTDPAYYKWTQWMFQQFFKYGMAYKAASTINWCPRCKIGLANEEAQGGVCERCGNGVEKREKKQWMIRITKYAERLIRDLDGVDYLEKIKAQQVNWIGKSEGAYVDFAIKGSKVGLDKVTVFTTRPDTLFGVTYLVLAPEHPLVEAWIKEGDVKNIDTIRAYQAKAAAKTEMERTTEGKEKTGVALDGVVAVNPASGEQVPVWVSDYVLGGYGTGAIMAVPAHDERDFAFAKQMGLPIKQVVAPVFIDHTNPPQEGKKTVARPTVQCLLRDPKTNSFACLAWKNYAWKTFIIGGIDPGESPADAALREIREETGYKHIRVVQTLGSEVIAKYFAAHKDENRTAIVTGVMLELIDDEREELTAEESAKHDVVWVPEAEVTSFVKGAEILELWKRLKNGAEGEMVLEGEMIHSGFLDGLSTDEAKAKMVAWLDAERKGAATTTYKLRDWVFSRQRYWGEPIPLMHCESCAKTKQKVLLIHGFEGGAEKNWLPWMKRELEAAGMDVMAPTMTTADHPDLARWMQELQPMYDQLGERDLVVAHSLGGRALLHLLAASRKKIGAAILVASAFGSATEQDWQNMKATWEGSDIEALRTFWEAPIDLERATRQADAKILVVSDDDREILPRMNAFIPEGWMRQSWHGFGHFTGDQYPELLDEVLSLKRDGWVMDERLPLELPEIGAYEPTDSGESPLSKAEEWVNVRCPRCGGNATRETDTMPNWAGSSWYFLRYADPHNQDAFASPEALKQWMPVNLYNGGMEHTTLHLLYSRFWHKFLWDIGAIPKECGSEPYAKRRSHGLILAEGGEKMSKSKGNVVNPDDVVSKYGADVFRVYEMFMGPFDQPVPWDVNGIEGVRRFLDKVWDLFEKEVPASNGDLDTLFHQTVKKLTDGIEQMQFNTCVSALMILMNAYQETGGIPATQRSSVVQILAPFAPHLAEELWQKIGGMGSVHARGAGWPSYDASKLVAATFELVVQVNGKVRDRLRLASGISEEEAKKQALASEAVQKLLSGAAPKQVIYVKGKLVNIVA